METVVGFGWAELTGTNVTSPRLSPWAPVENRAENRVEDAPDSTGASTPTGGNNVHEVPLPPTNVMLEDDQQSLRSVTSPFHEAREAASPDLQGLKLSSTTNNTNPFTGLFNFFRKDERPKTPPPPSPKQNKIYQRSQTLKSEDFESTSASSSKTKVTSGHELSDGFEGLSAPPKTTFFEAAGDLLNPKLPSVEYLIDPSKRPRTIFHDRIYHPSDIPPPQIKRRSTTNALGLLRKSNTRTFASTSSTQTTPSSDNSSPFPSPRLRNEDSNLSQRDYDDTANTNPDMDPMEMIDTSQMKVEEKIARAYHRGLSWRKVLVKLEPDAHNNLIVRRMFANAFGWPVVHHLVDAHFSDSAAARTRDEDEANTERAKHPLEPPDKTGGEVNVEPRSKSPFGDGAGDAKGQYESEARDVLHDLPRSSCSAKATVEADNSIGSGLSSPSSSPRPRLDRHDSVTWSDRDWIESGDESDDDMPFGEGNSIRRPSRELKNIKEHRSIENKEQDRSSSPTTWNWTEKIVGRGALQRRSKSPTSSAIGAARQGSVTETSPPPSSVGTPEGIVEGNGSRASSPAGPDIHVRPPSI